MGVGAVRVGAPPPPPHSPEANAKNNGPTVSINLFESEEVIFFLIPLSICFTLLVFLVPIKTLFSRLVYSKKWGEPCSPLLMGLEHGLPRA